jgi:hypothetical protein
MSLRCVDYDHLGREESRPSVSHMNLHLLRALVTHQSLDNSSLQLDFCMIEKYTFAIQMIPQTYNSHDV